MKEHSVMINGQKLSDQPVKIYMSTYDNIWKTITGQGDDYTTGCLLDYPYFKKHYNLIPVELKKQQTLYADPKAIQKINFTENLNRPENTKMFFINEEAKETLLDFSQGPMRVLWMCSTVLFCFKHKMLFWIYYASLGLSKANYTDNLKWRNGRCHENS